MHLVTTARRLLAFCALATIPAFGQAAVAPQSAPPVTSRFHEPAPEDFNDHEGYIQIFDGRSLADWEGDPTHWRVENGAIVGESSAQNPITNTYIWRKGIIAHDFDLKLEIKCEIGGGSGIQYRSQTGIPWDRPQAAGLPPYNLDWMMTGPQADFWFPVNPLHASYSGQIYAENSPLGIEVWRGEIVQSSPGAGPHLIGSLGNRDELGGYIKINDWNEYEIIARGGTLIQIINGHVMAVLIDDDPSSINNKPGKIGIELEHAPAKVSVRNIWLRKLN